ncbi:Homeobox protein unc-62 [Thelohanellus kitauei]|uniref:Homeobox protein unc-62 n=1 Tax=Thelohanellus kitauei TaxID=669202 RepID=A0A0C2M0Q3_THEKT|nr:Homeobox protein unc-62 [Thelohanellus kitauei]
MTASLHSKLVITTTKSFINTKQVVPTSRPFLHHIHVITVREQFIHTKTNGQILNFIHGSIPIEVINSIIYPECRCFRLRRSQTDYLQRWYYCNMDDPYPSKQEKINLARASGLSELQVNNWFSNIRRREKRLTLQLQLGRNGASNQSNNSNEGETREATRSTRSREIINSSSDSRIQEDESKLDL